MKICISILLSLLHTSISISQESEGGRHMVTNYKGFEIGFAYPLLTHNKRFATLIETHINHGVRGGFAFGRIYNSGFSVSLTPSIIYVSVPNTVYKALYSRPKDLAITYHNVSLALPALVEKNIVFNGTLGVGLSLAMPMWSGGKFNEHDLDLFFLPRKEDYFPRRDNPYLRLSFLLRSTFPLSHKSERKTFICLEYLQYTSHNHQTGSFEKLFSLTFSHRIINSKEKRFKWDRALIKN